MKIVEFGECLLRDDPVRKKYSPFSLFIGQLEKSVGVTIEKVVAVFEKVILISTFTYFESDVLDAKPDVVILQFGNQDATVGLEEYLTDKINTVNLLEDIVNKKHDSQLVVGHYKTKPIVQTLFLLKYVICRVLNIVPGNCNLEKSVDIVKEISEICKQKQIKLIVLSTLPSIDLLYNFYGKKYALILNKLSTEYGYTFINLRPVLNRCKKNDTFLSDGCHLSALGHEIVVETILRKFRVYVNRIT